MMAVVMVVLMAVMMVVLLVVMMVSTLSNSHLVLVVD